MSVILEIEDGDPWWMSPNVWTVPGDDPTGAPGLPVVGKPCYLWARVRNNGTQKADDVTVRYYWADPSPIPGFDRNTAHTVGSSFVSLDAGQTAEVLCLVPWIPTWLNGGHECILAEAFHSLDQLPSTPVFDVPTDRHVAQHNLSVVMVAEAGFNAPFAVHNPLRIARDFTLTAKIGKLKQLEKLLPLMGRNFNLGREDGRAHDFGFVEARCPTTSDTRNARPKVQFKLTGHERAGYCLVGKVSDGPVLIHIAQEEGGRVVGGLSVLVLLGRE